MKTSGGKQMGRFAVDLEVANNDDVVQARHGNLPPDKVRRLRIRGVVDSGAGRLVLPKAVAKQHLEDLDFLVDCNRQQLVPRDPDFVVSEIE
jgi:hypothetical protein